MSFNEKYLLEEISDLHFKEVPYTFLKVILSEGFEVNASYLLSEINILKS